MWLLIICECWRTTEMWMVCICTYNDRSSNFCVSLGYTNLCGLCLTQPSVTRTANRKISLQIVWRIFHRFYCSYRFPCVWTCQHAIHDDREIITLHHWYNTNTCNSWFTTDQTTCNTAINLDVCNRLNRQQRSTKHRILSATVQSEH